MAADVAVELGMDGDDNKVAFIKRKMYDVIDDLNLERLWQFNLIQAADITSTGGTSDYAVPADLWRIYSVRKSNDIDYLLTTLQQKNFDVIFQSQNNITGFPYVDVNFNIYRDGTIKLFPTPDGVYTFELRYFRLIPKPTADNEFLDMPSPFQKAPKYGALARMWAMVDHSVHAVRYWENKYQEITLKMKRSDEEPGDENLRFIAGEEMDARNLAYINPALRPRYLDFY